MATKDKLVTLEDLNELKKYNDSEVSDLKSDLGSLANDGVLRIDGNDHNYYFGGGANYNTVTVAGSTHTKVFPIENGAKYFIKITGNQKNIGFANEEYTTTGTLSDNVVKSEYEFTVTNTNNYKYLYVFYYNSNTSTVENADVVCTMTSNLVLTEDATNSTSIDIGTFLDGYVLNYSLTPYSTTSTIKHTNYVEVDGATNITIENYCTVGSAGLTALVFDKNKNGISTINDGIGGGANNTKSFDLPIEAKYIVFNVRPSTYTPRVYYSAPPYKWAKAESSIEKLLNVAPKNFMELFKTATEKPICCIIDDDTLNATDMENFATVLENNGVRGTVACLTKFFETQNDLEAKLHDLERRGHQVVLHGYTQATAYRDAVSFDDANYKLAESDFVKGLTDLKLSGFCNCEYWVTPYGISQACMQRLAKKWGMKCLVTTAKTEYNGTDGKYSRWEIQRSGLTPSDSTGTLTYQQLVDLADDCAENNGWLLINTHIYDWTNGYTRLNNFITHCKEKGFEFMTLGEAWTIRKYIYDWYSTF